MEYDAGSVAFERWKRKATSGTAIACEDAQMGKGYR